MTTLRTVERALKILKILTAHHEGMGTAEISSELDISMPTASRLLNTLKNQNFVQHHPIIKKYMLGKAALDIGRSFYKHIGIQLVSVAEPYLEALRDNVQESVILEAFVGNDVILIYRANGPDVVSILVKVGTKVPVHASPGAKAILAFCPAKLVNRILKKKLNRYTSKTITSPRDLKDSFKKIRRDGVAFSFGEYYADMNALGAPVFNQDREPIAAIVIAMPAYRTKLHQESKLVSLLKETAEKVSAQLIKYDVKGQSKF